MNGRGLKSMVLVRLLQLPFILLAIYTITFMLIWVIPGNPLEKPEGRRPPDEIINRALLEAHGLDVSPRAATHEFLTPDIMARAIRLNAWWDGAAASVRFVVKQAVQPGDELLFSYGDAYWDFEEPVDDESWDDPRLYHDKDK